MLLMYLFCFKVTDQIKYSINESLITLDIGQWILILNWILISNVIWNVTSASGILIVATGKHSHFVWPDQRFFDFKINFLFEFVSSSSSLLIVSMVAKFSRMGMFSVYLT